ncbi:type VII secretion protein EssA [Liquorilactobacillus hordei]|uniref:type VII secretion protein EssA n=1 Tax=Liquorilactobacillus hordei TaxID=468911 RepID=UPI0039ED3905
MKKIYILILGIIVSTLMMTETTVKAANGDMDINDEVIYQNDNSKSQSQYSSFDISDLFLPAKNKYERKIVKRRQVNIQKAKKRVFLASRVKKTQSFKQNITRRLFQANYQKVANQQSGVIGTSNQNKTEIYLLGVIGISLALFLGIYLGSKFPQWRKNYLKERSKS